MHKADQSRRNRVAVEDKINLLTSLPRVAKAQPWAAIGERFQRYSPEGGWPPPFVPPINTFRLYTS
jgi:hypothetical protein